MMNERIKELRKAVGLTQQAFADKLGLKRNTVGGYEIATVIPSDRTITDMCRVFSANEKWLRSGEGEMFVDVSREVAISAFVGSVLATEDDTFKKRFIAMLTILNDEDLVVLEKMTLEIAEMYLEGKE